MKFSIHKDKYLAVILLLAVPFAACRKTFTDPSGPSFDQAFSSAGALTDVAVGLQNWYTAGRGGLVYNTVTGDGLLTNQLYVVNAGNTDEAQLGTGGGTVQNTNGILNGTWSVSNKIIYDANNVISHAGIVSDRGYASGLVAYASIFKALAIGDMAMFWDHIPDTTGKNAGFITSAAAFTRAIAVIDNALGTISANPVSSSFLANIPKGIDIPNTLYALKARYALFAGNYSLAQSAAGNVNLAVKSFFAYNAIVTNPVFTLATSTNNIYQPVDSAMGLPAGLQPDAGDKREPFYIGIASNPRFRINGFYNATTTGIPVYLPGEITLIKAECYASQNDVANGLAELNKVVTKQPSADPFGVGAGLPPVAVSGQADLLVQIYKHRCIELFMSGLKLQDMKRLGRPVSERKRNFYPFPFVERNDNANTPPDPAF